jgi:hypothetical protein
MLGGLSIDLSPHLRNGQRARMIQGEQIFFHNADLFNGCGDKFDTNDRNLGGLVLTRDSRYPVTTLHEIL